LKEEGIAPGPDRKNDCWKEFIERNTKTLWAVDFFSVKTVTSRGLKQMYVLVWLCMTTREVIVSESTLHPNSAWVEKQADLFVDQTIGRENKPDIVMHDLDTKFTKEFTAKLVQFEPRAKPIVAIAVHCRSHMTIKTTPAVAAGWAKEPWTLERLLNESASSLS
jgi:hypothetical protein